MRTPRKSMERLIEIAANLRAGGSSWKAIGAQLQRTEDTCRRWPRVYREYWDPLFRAAEEQILIDAGCESLLTLRKLTRSADEKIQTNTSKFIYQTYVRVRKLGQRADNESAPSRLRTIADFVEGLSHEEAQELVNEMSALPLPLQEHAVDGNGNGRITP